MDKIKRELFSGKNKTFKVNELLNSLLKSDQIIDDEILSFKLKLIQREFTTEIDSNMNKFLGFSKNLDEDLKNFNQTNGNYLTRINEFSQQTSYKIKDEEELDKGYQIKTVNNNLRQALFLIENK